jgi:hypothetical protein
LRYISKEEDQGKEKNIEKIEIERRKRKERRRERTQKRSRK